MYLIRLVNICVMKSVEVLVLLVRSTIQCSKTQLYPTSECEGSCDHMHTTRNNS